MIFASPWPWWAVVAAVAAAVWLALAATARAADRLSAARRGLLVALRVLAILLVVVLLMRPVRVAPVAETGSTVAVLIDASRSMTLDDGSGRSRLDAARTMLGSTVKPALGPRFAVEPYAFGSRTRAWDDGDPEIGRDGRSDLSGALHDVRERFRGRSLAGIIVVSDGAVAGGAPASPGVPVFAIPVGPTGPVRDREVSAVGAGDASIVDAIVPLVTTIVSRGAASDRFDVSLLENGRPIDVRNVVTEAEGGARREVFRVSPRRDRATLYEIVAAAAPGELTTANNRFAVLIPPAGRPKRILLLEGVPGFEHSFLKRSLDDDAGLLVDAVVRKGRNEQGEDTFYVQAAPARTAPLARGFPATRAALFDYDVVVLGNVEADRFTRPQAELLEAFVSQRGGGLVMLGTRSFDARALAASPLQTLLPVELAGGALSRRAGSKAPDTGRVELTDEGAEHPIMRLGATVEETTARWAKIPPLSSTIGLGAPKSGATVLAWTAGQGGNVRPLLVTERFGRGRVLAFFGEASFRWRMMLPAADRTYDTFWRQLTRWAAGAGGDPVGVEVDETTTTAAANITVRDAEHAPVRDAAVHARVTLPDGTARNVTAALADAANGTYRVALPLGGSGMYRVEATATRGTQTVGTGETWWLAGGHDAELADPRRHDATLSRLAESTGGRVVSEGDLASIAASLSGRAGQATPLVQDDLWDSPWSFLALFACLGAEWTLRRRWGLR